MKNRMKVFSYLLPVSEALKDSEKEPIFFQFLPRISGDSRGANYTQPAGSALGRAEQFNVFQSSSNKSLTIEAQFAATGEEVIGFGGGDGERKAGIANEVWVQRQVKRLQALCEPIYDRDLVTERTVFHAPPLVLFTYGLRYINVPVVVKSVGVEDESNTMIDGFGALPQVTRVTIQIETNYPYGYVPGYLNTIRLFDSDGRINPNQHNFDGSNDAFLGGAEDVLVDTVSPTRTLAASKIEVINVSEA